MKARMLTAEPPSDHRAARERGTRSQDSMRARSASEILGTLKPPTQAPMHIEHTGLWKTGWLPQPETAA